MLVLSRNIGETVVIGGNLVVEVLHVQGKRVRLGFKGDQSVLRGELDPAGKKPSDSAAPTVKVQPAGLGLKRRVAARAG